MCCQVLNGGHSCHVSHAVVVHAVVEICDHANHAVGVDHVAVEICVVKESVAVEICVAKEIDAAVNVVVGNVVEVDVNLNGVLEEESDAGAIASRAVWEDSDSEVWNQTGPVCRRGAFPE
mmetsp:Transcript_88541/g.153230  ORF Transcript_88541/g.153230 Transcript_88541/m.153230 type:complete len:120 (+) Transcript_88541:36-395(+)